MSSIRRVCVRGQLVLCPADTVLSGHSVSSQRHSFVLRLYAESIRSFVVFYVWTIESEVRDFNAVWTCGLTELDKFNRSDLIL